MAAASTAAASPAAPSKAEARKAAVAKMNGYLRANAWAKSGAVGKCTRISMQGVFPARTPEQDRTLVLAVAT